MPRRGEVWLARLDKVRPVVVLSRDPMGQHLDRLIAVPVSTRGRGLHVEVVLDRRDGLLHQSFANLDTVQQVDQSDLIDVIGVVRPEKMDEICAALATAVDCG